MGKRSNFDRIERDFYPTPIEAVKPLIPHLPVIFTFIEPCAGNGVLIDHLKSLVRCQCVGAFDIEPQRKDITQLDSLQLQHKTDADYIITNPPWDRKLLHPMIENFIKIAPTWLLFDSDWMHTKQSIPYMKYLSRVVSIGRVKWIPDSKMTGKDNCCWYLFDKNNQDETVFVGRQLILDATLEEYIQ